MAKKLPWHELGRKVRMEITPVDDDDELFQKLTLETKGQPQPKTPKAKKQHVAEHLGIAMTTLDNYVSKWRSKHGKDLPWVIRKPGFPWFPDLQKFAEWLTTSEGKKRKKKRGRPRQHPI